MPARIAVGVASEERLAAFQRLTETYYRGKPVNDPRVVRWRHLEDPSGPSATVELMEGEESVGRMWIRVHSWSIRGRTVKAANPIDFLIREDHRKLPEFLSLFKATMREAQRLSDLVYHTSNPLTDDLYRKLMKLKPASELDAAALPVRPFGAAQAAKVLRTGFLGRVGDSLFAGFVRLLAGISQLTGIRLSSSPPALDQERVMAALVSEEEVCGLRSPEHRAWRHRGAGPIAYQEHWLNRRGRPLGYVVTSDRDVEGLRGCYVVDVVLPGRPSWVTRWAAWLQVAGLAARRGCHAVFLLYNRSNPRLAKLASLPMVAIPRARLPQRIPVFVAPTKGADRELFAGVDFSRGYYVLADFDMF